MHPSKTFQYREEQLYCEETALERIAEEFGTPCYVYSARAVRENYRRLKRAFAAVAPKICYAVKANSNLSILRLLKEEGSSFDIVSGGELFRLHQAGVASDRVIYSGTGKTDRELESAIEHKIFSIVVESQQELRRIIDLSGNREVRISLRLNPDVDPKTHPYISTGLKEHKFGIDEKNLHEILALLRLHENIRLTGIGAHIGSQILDSSPFLETFERIRQRADVIRGKGFPVTHLDLGGGFGIPYQNEAPFPLEELAEGLRGLRSHYEIVIEPGRYIVATAGVLLTRLLLHKTNQDKHFYIVDAGMNDLIRPPLYDAYHDVLPVQSALGELQADVVGPVCETADFLAKGRFLPRMTPGDLLAVMDAGAYAFVAASNYNSRPRAAEVLVDGEKARLIRKRENYEDLIRAEQF